MIALGQKGIDFAFAPDSAAGIAKNGAHFVCRYSAGTDSTNGKCTQPGEIGHVVAVGMDFFANFELSESTPEQGAGAGKQHGSADKGFWAGHGLAAHAGVIVSWEPGNNSGLFSSVAAFIEAYKHAIGRPVGLYAGLPALVEMRRRQLIDFTWLPMSSAASNVNFGNVPQAVYAASMEKLARDHGINMCQNRNRWYGVGGDENVITTLPHVPFSHLEALHQPPTPAPKPAPDVWHTGDDRRISSNGQHMLLIDNNGQASVWTLEHNQWVRRHFLAVTHTSTPVKPVAAKPTATWHTGEDRCTSSNGQHMLMIDSSGQVQILLHTKSGWAMQGYLAATTTAATDIGAASGTSAVWHPGDDRCISSDRKHMVHIDNNGQVSVWQLQGSSWTKLHLLAATP